MLKQHTLVLLRCSFIYQCKWNGIVRNQISNCFFWLCPPIGVHVYLSLSIPSTKVIHWLIFQTTRIRTHDDLSRCSILFCLLFGLSNPRFSRFDLIIKRTSPSSIFWHERLCISFGFFLHIYEYVWLWSNEDHFRYHRLPKMNELKKKFAIFSK